MFRVKRSHERGYFEHGWLTTFHTFSFGEYFDRHNMHFRNLRVINEDRVAPGHGFEMHPHKDMEIITYIISGALEHRDSMGNGAVVRPGEIQYMSAGSGVLHSEKNPSMDDECHLLQIWIIPDKKGQEPRYDQRSFNYGPLVPLVVPESQLKTSDEADGKSSNPIGIRAETSIYAGTMAVGHSQTINLPHGFGWVQVVTGDVVISRGVSGSDSGSRIRLNEGDGLAISEEPAIRVTVSGSTPASLLIFVLP